MQIVCQESLYRIGLCCSWQGIQKKWKNTAILSDNYNFVPAGVKTYGAYGPQGIKLIKQIGKKIQEATDDKLSTFLLYVCHPVIC